MSEHAVEPTLEQAAVALSSLGASLLSSYQALEKRAERVEEELSRANAALERKVAELDRVTRDLEAILEALPTGVVVRDRAGALVRSNAAARAILGVAEVELEPRARALLGGAPQGAAGGWREGEHTGPDGARRVLATRSSPVRGPAGADQGSVQILDDRTELAALAERLHGLDKLAALGNMAGGIAHELRNPMNAIKGFASLLERRLEAGSKEHRWAGLIVAGVGEADQILSSMLTLAAPQRLQLERVEPRELLADAVRQVEADKVPEGAPSPWRIACRAEAPPFAGDRVKLRQALRNLVANAVEAQPGGGRVEVAALLEGDELLLRVRDAGPGIPSELRGKVLDPFFTTRADGTGLGLALASTIAQLHGGRVDVHPERSPLGGAEIALRLPHRTA